MIFARAWLVACGLVALGAVGGLAFDPRPARPVVHRAGYRVLEADLHAHTTYSDGTLSPLTLVRQAERRGLDVLAVTEHNTAIAGHIARWWTRRSDGPIVLVGEEITTRRYHLVALGIEHTVIPNRSIESVVAEVHAQGGLVVAAHPVERFQPGLAPIRRELDGTEVMHPLAFVPPRPGWSWKDMLSFYEETTPHPAAIGSSDYHFASLLGLCRTLVFAREPAGEDTVLEALRAHRTVVFDREGKPYGDPALIAALEREPYVPRSSDYAYRGDGVLDRVLRLVGLAGVIGVVFLRRSSAPLRVRGRARA